MERYIYDQNNGLWHQFPGDYYIPCLPLPVEETQPIGLWRQSHRNYPKEHRKVIHATMIIHNKLNCLPCRHWQAGGGNAPPLDSGKWQKDRCAKKAQSRAAYGMNRIIQSCGKRSSTTNGFTHNVGQERRYFLRYLRPLTVYVIVTLLSVISLVTQGFFQRIFSDSNALYQLPA